MTRIVHAIVAATIVPSVAWGWGVDGHQIICLIAEERLSSAARAAIRQLLGEQATISDAEVAVWADGVRPERRGTVPWHYVNIPTSQPAFDAGRDGRDGNNVIAKVAEFELILADRTKPKEIRAEALKFLVHFVGDMHQPLHCADRNGDRGGNARLVFFLDEPQAINLHYVWDTRILLHWKAHARITSYAHTLNSMVRAPQAAGWVTGSAALWANESHRIAINEVYREVPSDGDPPKLGKAYMERAGPVVDVQLQRAGVRLASILNRALADRRRYDFIAP